MAGRHDQLQEGRVRFVGDAAPQPGAGVVGPDHPVRRGDAAQPQRRRRDVDVIDRERPPPAHPVVAAPPPADDERHPDRLLPGRGLEELPVRPVQVAVVREEDDVRVVGQPRLVERDAEAPEVPVEVLDLRVVAGQFAPRPLHDARHVRHVGAQVDPSGRVPRHPFGGRDVGVVRRLHREDREEGLPPARGALPPALAQVGDGEVGQRVGLVAGQAIVERPLPRATVDPRIPLAVVVLVAGPRVEVATPLRRHDVHGAPPVTLVPAVEVPLAEVGGLVAGPFEDGGDGRLAGRQGIFVARHALMRVAAGQQRAAVGGAEGRAGDRGGADQPLGRQPVEVRRVQVRVAHVPLGLRPVLVAEDPEDIGPRRLVPLHHPSS